ncbi:MAG: UDP-N-acetylglucosamine 2-epimerase (non-hydrolyzing) [Firmicutes bacterium]|jgi:UDP-N-acetylglucosamine 2-epimerase (non-hydrolysing)|nr:UDP-N-acetylglucosamine 2-epimerase (non-hydrolyzing) [Bacillota bacterium]
MHKVHVLSVFGTRPEAVKMAPLIKELESEPLIKSTVCVTGQHREMLEQVLKIFQIVPDFDLKIMENNQDLSTTAAKCLEGVSQVIKELNPDFVLVHGDTSTTFAAALAAFYQKVPVGHVEAGLRTQNKYSPFPEEINRRLTASIAELHFAPTVENKQNLLQENITAGIYVTGNTVIDAMKYTIKDDSIFHERKLNEINFSRESSILLTAHRRENVGEPLIRICKAVKRILKDIKGLKFIYPVHLNPRVRETVFDILGDEPGVLLTDPLDVVDMHNLMKRCWLVMTDSGGLQEEAPFLGKPVLLLRDNTERPEALAAGTVKLVGTAEERIYQAVADLLNNEEEYSRMASAKNPYGDGNASKRIVQAILYRFGLADEPHQFY